MKVFARLILAAVIGLSGWAWVQAHDMPAPPPTTKEFQQMKQLVGTWKGTSSDMGKESEDITVIYQLTSGGSALTEMLTPGTPHEMLSVYADEGGKLAMTHYCMLGNHPRMQLSKSEANELDFVMKQKDPSIPAAAKHMHGVTLYFQDADHLMQKWSCYENGKENQVVTLKLARVKT